MQTSEQKQQRTNMFIQISRVHRKRSDIRSFLQEYEEQESRPETEVIEINSSENSFMNHPITLSSNSSANFSVNWLDFWNRSKIYPEHEVAYPDASQHVSSRQRRRPDFQRQRSNAYVTDTDDSDLEEDVVIN